MISFIKSANTIKEWPDSDKEIVFIGRSNVGKSSLINSLYKNKLAFVGKTPGKTRMLNFFDINKIYTVCDAPGYGYANRNAQEIVLFGEMMEEYFTKRNALKLAVVILDSRHKPTNDDLDMIEYLKSIKKPYIVVLSKSDKLSNNQLNNNIKEISASLNIEMDKLIAISSLKNKNIDLLKEKIEKYL